MTELRDEICTEIVEGEGRQTDRRKNKQPARSEQKNPSYFSVWKANLDRRELRNLFMEKKQKKENIIKYVFLFLSTTQRKHISDKTILVTSTLARQICARLTSASCQVMVHDI
jgi:hypothetical protein